jgi:hypothetical protein
LCRRAGLCCKEFQVRRAAQFIPCWRAAACRFIYRHRPQAGMEADMLALKFDCELIGGRELPAQHWPGERGVVRVSCDRWGPAVVAALEAREVRADGNVLPWQRIATFDRNSEQVPPLPPGEVRFQIGAPDDDVARKWRLSVSEQEAAPAKPISLEQRVARLEAKSGRGPRAA